MSELKLAHIVKPISKARALILETVKDFLEIYCKKSVPGKREFWNAFYHALCNSGKKYYSPELVVRQEMDLYRD